MYKREQQKERTNGFQSFELHFFDFSFRFFTNYEGISSSTIIFSPVIGVVSTDTHIRSFRFSSPREASYPHIDETSKKVAFVLLLNSIFVEWEDNTGTTTEKCARSRTRELKSLLTCPHVSSMCMRSGVACSMYRSAFFSPAFSLYISESYHIKFRNVCTI